MTKPDPTKLKDPIPQFKWAGVSALIALICLLFQQPIGALPLLLALSWGITGLWRYVKIRRWLKQRNAI